MCFKLCLSHFEVSESEWYVIRENFVHFVEKRTKITSVNQKVAESTKNDNYREDRL